MTHTLYCSTEQELLAFAAQCAKKIPAHAGLIIFLSGDLGAGKTTFARGFLNGFGFTGKVKSPTYTLVETYLFSHHSVAHFDFYRIKKSEELEYAGIREYFSPQNICLIEWPEKGLTLLPTADIHIKFEILSQGRQLTIHALNEQTEHFF